jgi:hypothetical protein
MVVRDGSIELKKILSLPIMPDNKDNKSFFKRRIQTYPKLVVGKIIAVIAYDQQRSVSGVASDWLTDRVAGMSEKEQKRLLDRYNLIFGSEGDR